MEGLVRDKPHCPQILGWTGKAHNGQTLSSLLNNGCQKVNSSRVMADGIKL
jgi:hypothetical protein